MRQTVVPMDDREFVTEFVSEMMGEDDGSPMAHYMHRHQLATLGALPWVSKGRGVALVFAICDRKTPEEQANLPVEGQQNHHDNVYHWLNGLRESKEKPDAEQLLHLAAELALTVEDEEFGGLGWVTHQVLDDAWARAESIEDKWHVAWMAVR